ncbi:AAA family ATPase [uncultured Ornithinimicrobium sp.]|uniref:AAA family ATPase n=2 Tax=Ornithinimicrobium TaxID=125287 RepID=UPI002592D53C|nr:AAA family ATPase [uncultured Ornithinimicrobium sp.]
MDTTALQARLEHVLWIGGGSGSGKSTVARRLAEQDGLHLYSTDEAMGRHADRLGPAQAPLLAAFMTMDMDQRWCHRSTEQMLQTFHWFAGEGFDLIVEDLLAMPREPVVVEGFRLLPRLVAPLSAAGRRVWLLPTPQFRRNAFAARGSLWQIAGRTSNPELALANLLERDRLFTEQLRTEADARGLPAVDVDDGVTTEELMTRVRQALQTSPPD